MGKMLKLLEYHVENLDNLEYGDETSETVSKAWSMKEITDDLDFIKIENVCSVKDTAKKMRSQASYW